MTEQDTSPQISKTAFSCPRCGAYTTQYWYKLYAESYSDGSRTPNIPTHEMREDVAQDSKMPEEAKKGVLEWCDKILSKKPFFEDNSNNIYNPPIVYNLNVSRCYNCRGTSVWVNDELVHPNRKLAIPPNVDLPEHIKQLFEEAREIVGPSPKGASALLRLSIQHLCIELGQNGKNLDKAIGNLVQQGLNPLVQKALDVVRVIGNESVHPGEIDLNDNRDIAIKLFGLVNLICEQMISHPKHVDQLYSGLPQSKLEGIQKRDIKQQIDNDT